MKFIADINKNMILFLPWGGYGDKLLATATLKKLRKLYSKSRIYCYNRKRALEILAHNTCIDRFISFPHQLFNKENLRAAINNPEADPMIFYSAYGDLRPTGIVPHRHAVKIIGDMVGVKVDGADIRVDFAESDLDFAARFKRELAKPFVLLQVTPRSHPRKAWLTGRWAEAVRFLTLQGKTVVQVGCADEEPVPGAVNLLGKTTLLQALALLTEAVFFLGIDSVFQHAAYALKVPALVLFGPSTPEIWGWPDHVNVYKNLPCQPCVDKFPRSCPEPLCMLGISSDEVITAARSLL